ncbi:DUF2264 domain-containing protein [Terriglobus aquaticus]|uniref:DUF2264 domain-containing protein n=1 Tax=Terriglobus aquaticus TaxID=940139 RepID=A0ABW9KS09_9BACT|nr:DUF2264 domain-containing protein [Terriglobus aquaticus]
MTTRRGFLVRGAGAAMAASLPVTGAAASAVALQRKAEANEREQWLSWVERLSEPVLLALSERRLRATMPVEAKPGLQEQRAIGTHLEALGRLLMGLAPWLELEPGQGESARETKLRERYRGYARAAIASAVDPQSPDYMRWSDSAQTVVDASFLALALLRAPKQLLDTMDAGTRSGMIAAMVKERRILTGLNNWVLFAAMDEALLFRLGAEWDRMRVAYALNELQSWYVGDGMYGDGPHFHADNYNSYVMQPYLLMLMQVLGEQEKPWAALRESITARATRYAAIQERMIAPDGTFPVLGRSITYRAGAFHLLADASLRGMLPQHMSPAQVRGALTAVQQRTLDVPGTFDVKGWLQIGLAGHQPDLGEPYISTGSLYLCSAAWLPLGLPPSHTFWAAPAEPWTQKKVWAGANAPADHAIAD